MARNRVFSRRLWSENLDCSDPSPMHSEDLHILAVDDSLVDRKFIERLLRISSCKVTAVDSGRRALQFLGLDDEKRSVGFDALKVNMIITDYCMPGMTGYELLKRIKESSTFREIPVVIMSSDNILTRIDRCLEEGAEEYLVKPVKLSDVKRLKDYITKMEKKVTEHKGTGNFKRKFLDACDNSSSSSSSRSVSPSPPPSPPSSPSASSLSPPLPPSSPSSFESPTRRLRSDTE